MKNIFFAFASLLLLSGCSNDEDSPVTNGNADFKIQSYHSAYARYPITVYPNADSDNLIKFEYDAQGRIKKRIGDIIYTSVNAGSGAGYISDSLFTDLTYFENKVKLTKGISYLGYQTPTNEAIISFDAQHRMVQKIATYQQLGSGIVRTDTTNFSYVNDKLKHSSKLVLQHSDSGFDIYYSEVADFYYIGGNLDSIVTMYSHTYSDTSYTVLEKKETEIYSGFDDAPNPFRHLQIFDETFTRSLSKNNYTNVRFVSVGYQYPNFDYDQEPTAYIAVDTTFQYWPYSYDEHGEWICTQL